MSMFPLLLQRSWLFQLVGIIQVLSLNLGAAEKTAAKVSMDMELSEYRTVAQAKTATISRTNAAVSAHSGHLGVAVMSDKGGRLVVESVEVDSPASAAGILEGDLLLKADGRSVKS